MLKSVIDRVIDWDGPCCTCFPGIALIVLTLTSQSASFE